MAEHSGASSEAVQFRRQLIATVAGALIAMSTSAGVSVFQWFTQSRERSHQARIVALSEFAATLPTALASQADAWHWANRCLLLATRARRLASRLDLNKPDAVNEYKDLTTAAWVLEAALTGAFQEEAKRRATVSAAYYKLLVAFDDLPTFGMPTMPEQMTMWQAMSESPNGPELVNMATMFQGYADLFNASAVTAAKTSNAWNQKLNELTARIRKE